MPMYDYRCPANGRTVEAAHAMSETVATWGDLCARAGIAPGDTPPESPVEKAISLVSARTGTPQRPAGSCGSGCGCHPN